MEVGGLNALDRSHLFKASKKVLMMEKKCKTLNPIDFSDASLNNAIIKKIKEKQPNITALKRRLIAKALVKNYKVNGLDKLYLRFELLKI